MNGCANPILRKIPWRYHCTKPQMENVFIAIGSNIGDRATTIRLALKHLRKYVEIHRTSALYESKPMYVTEQPSFLNGAVQVRTTLPAIELLQKLKLIENNLGRDQHGIRNGPRPIDLDIITYGTRTIEKPTLMVPHPRLSEREFVLRPLCDIQPRLPIGERTAQQLLDELLTREKPGLVRVTPMRSGRLLRWGERTLLMGIINATPDSFSDGGAFNTVETALCQAQKFSDMGFDVIDIGGQSTRPGSVPISVEEELSRVLPIIEAVLERYPHLAISCDTSNARVAAAALEAGAELVNDVSAGELDEGLHALIAEAGAATVQMHMRSTPKDMQTHAEYEDVVVEAGQELWERMERGMDAGIARWSMIADPGIGFAKMALQSVELVTRLREFQHACGEYPTLLGLSRKSWMKDVIGEDMTRRDWGTAGAVAAAVMGGGVGMVRLHNAAVGDAVRAADAVRRANLS